jgi:hypothetical protein
MTARDPLFVVGAAGAGQTSPTEARLALTGLVATGTGGTNIRAGVFQAASTNIVTGTSATGTMTYNVGACAVAVQRSSAGGVYLGANDGTAAVTTATAPASGSRYDLVWIFFPDVEQGDATSVAALGVTNGASSGSPSKPYGSVPVGALVLAEVLVPSTVTRTDTGTTITQVAPWTVARGAPVPVRSSTERGALTPYKGLVARRLDTLVDEQYDGSAWGPAGNLTYLNQTTPLVIASDNSAVTSNGSGDVTIVTGLSQIQTIVVSSASAIGTPNMTWGRNGSVTGGSAKYRIRDADTGAVITGQAIVLDWIAIGT